jgi:prephenate dehydrogenase
LKKPLASLADADPKVFVGATYALMPASDTPSSALETVVGYVETLGAQPAFMDREEYDSYSAAVSQLPVVVSCALMTTASGSESWREMHRVASAEFARLTELASEDPEATEVSCLANADSLVHWIDQLITELYAYRNQIKEGNDDLIENLVRAWEGRARWDADAVASNPGERMMSARESMSTAFLGERLTKRLAGIDADKKEPWKYKRRF